MAQGNANNISSGYLNLPLDNTPIGTIIEYSGTVLPPDYLACDGSAISRTTYADLFALTGTIYGSGDNSTTFNLPDPHNSGIPTSTPAFIGQRYIDTVSKREYVAYGTSSSADWIGVGPAAFVAFTVAGSTCTIIRSYNVSTVTYVSAGRYTVNFTNNLPNTNFVVNCNCNGGSDAFTTGANRQYTMQRTRAVGSVGIQIINEGGVQADATAVSVTIFN